jgi:hypothetical protein
MVASVSVIALTNSRDDLGMSVVVELVVNARPLAVQFPVGSLLLHSGRKLSRKAVLC